MIDDGPVFKLAIQRAVKRFEQDLQAWPRPPERGGDDWDSYWRWRFDEQSVYPDFRFRDNPDDLDAILIKGPQPKTADGIRIGTTLSRLRSA